MKSTLAAFAVAWMLSNASLIAAAPFAYITNRGSDDISVIDLATNAVVATVPANGNFSNYGVAVHPGGTRVYATHNGTGSTVSIVDTATNTRPSAIMVTAEPLGIAINAAGTRDMLRITPETS